MKSLFKNITDYIFHLTLSVCAYTLCFTKSLGTMFKVHSWMSWIHTKTQKLLKHN